MNESGPCSSEFVITLRCKTKDCKWEDQNEYLSRSRALSEARTHVAHTHHTVEVRTLVDYYWQEVG